MESLKYLTHEIQTEFCSFPQTLAYSCFFLVSGKFLYVNMSTIRSTKLGSSAILESSLINPPPRYHARPNSTYYKSCFVSFSLSLFLSWRRNGQKVVTSLTRDFVRSGFMKLTAFPRLIFVIRRPDSTGNRNRNRINSCLPSD